MSNRRREFLKAFGFTVAAAGPNPRAGCVRWGKQPGYVVFSGRKVPVERPRVRTREGQEVELESYSQLQQDGKMQRAVREGVVAGLSTRNLSD